MFGFLKIFFNLNKKKQWIYIIFIIFGVVLKILLIIIIWSIYNALRSWTIIKQFNNTSVIQKLIKEIIWNDPLKSIVTDIFIKKSLEANKKIYIYTYSNTHISSTNDIIPPLETH